MASLILLGQIGLIAGCALALCIYAGWGATHLGLPWPLRSSIVPLVGYAITIWAGYMGVSTALNLRWSLGILLALATALNLLAWRRGARPHLRAWLRAEAGLLGVLALTFLAGVLPLLHYGYLTAIGQGWDTESYWPMAQHLLDYPLARIPKAPISPLRDLVREPPQIGLTLGFSALQGMTMLLSGQSAIASFAPLLALLRALGILAVYAWLRATMGLGRGAALLGAALTSAGSLLLWVSYFNFGMQLAAWPLIPLGLILGLAAVESQSSGLDNAERNEPQRAQRVGGEGGLGGVGAAGEPRMPGGEVEAHRAQRVGGRWGMALLVAVVLAALPVAYYPALTIWVPLALGLGLARIIEIVRGDSGTSERTGSFTEHFHAVARLLLAAVALGALALPLVALPIQDYFEGFSFRYSLPAQHVGPDRFISVTDILGLTAFRLAGGGAQPPAALVLLASALTAVLALLGLALPGFRVQGSGFRVQETQHSKLKTQNSKLNLRWMLTLAAVLAYLAWLRFGRPYEYAFMKGSAYAGFVLWGVVALGAQTLMSCLRPSLRPVGIALALAPLLVAIWSQTLIVREHSAAPGIFTREIVAVEQAVAEVPRGATVAISSHASFAGPNSGLLASTLYGREIWGHLLTAFSGHNYWPEGGTPQYAILAAHEYPWPLALGGQELWRSAAAALYRLDDRLSMLRGRAAFYSAAPPTDRNSPAALALWRRGGPYRAATPGQPLVLLAGDTLRFGPGQPTGGPKRQQLRLTFATLAPQTITLSYGDTSAPLRLEAGISHVELHLDTPTPVTIAAERQVALIEALAQPADPASAANSAPAARLDDRQLAWSAAIEQRGTTIQTRVEFANPGRHALRLGLTVVEDTFTRPRQLARLLAAAPIEGSWQLALDPIRGATEARAGDQPTPLLSVEAAPDPPDGVYFGLLTLYDGEEAVAHEPLFTMRMAGGQIAAFEPAPFSVEVVPAGEPARLLPSNQRAFLDGDRALDGGQAVLEQALLARQPPWPGAPTDAPLPPGGSLTARLWWRAGETPAQPLMVSLQVIGADNHKWAQWDGPLGGEWRPLPNWQPGERVRQDVPLALDPATPPGDYRLLLVVYDPSNGQPQPIGGQQLLSLGEIVIR